MLVKTLVLLAAFQVVLVSGSPEFVGIGRGLVASTSSADCRTCINNSAQRWCASTGTEQTVGECCNSGDTTGYCASSSSGNSYVCSDSSNIESSGGFILCPVDGTICGSRSHSLSDTSKRYILEHSSITSNVVCSYRLFTTNGDVSKAKIKATTLAGLTTTLFTGPRDKNEYAYKATLAANNEQSISFSTSTDAYLVVEPSSTTNSFSITIEINGGDSSAVVVWVVSIVAICCCCGCCGLGILLCIWMIKKKGKEGKEGNPKTSFDNPEAREGVYQETARKMNSSKEANSSSHLPNADNMYDMSKDPNHQAPDAEEQN
ncbi:unnamed protein product [Moneuplotes crassus]|uniref:Uncharacterized protein n=1 Tax=Euplotes crassus TaxID=5936 RepID=A0AAD1UA91_EUPCR|nr:unnamed protein product [Moneuplotes crassus]